jgi:hypothetical protein
VVLRRRARALIFEASREEAFMSRSYPQSAVGIALDRAVLCPNDETVYDAEQWIVCPTCINKEGISLSRILGGSAAPIGASAVGWGISLLADGSVGRGTVATAASRRGEH